MSARDVLVRLGPRSVRLWAHEDRLRYKAPKGAMTPDLRGALQRHKQGLLRFLGQAEAVLAMALTQFEDARSCLEVQVPGVSETLWFVPGQREVESLLAEGVPRGRIWTAAELRELMTAPGLVHDDAVAVARAKIAFHAEVVDVRPSEVAPKVPSPDGPAGPVQARLDLGATDREFD